jgi:peptidoglycan/LPS O-acetylase OafA/YrhL
LLAGAGRPQNPFSVALVDQGHIGVQLFMVISGFIMVTIFDGRCLEPRKFYLNRILRIYPLLVLIVSFGYFATPDPRPSSAGIDYLLALLPISNLYRMSYGPFGGQMWTVAVELQFYLLFPLLLAFRHRYGRRNFFVGIFGLAVALRAAQYMATGTTHTFTFFTLFGNLDLFLAGMIVAKVHRSWEITKLTLSVWWSIAALVTLATIVAAIFSHAPFFHMDYQHVTADGISRSAYWIMWPTLQAAMWGVFVLLYLRSSGCGAGAVVANFGKWSYSTYVWHILVIEILKDRMLWIPSYLFGVAVVLPVTLAVSYASYTLIERPFLDLRSRYNPSGST